MYLQEHYIFPAFSTSLPTSSCAKRFFKNASKTQCKGREKPCVTLRGRAQKIYPITVQFVKICLNHRKKSGGRKDEAIDIRQGRNEMS